MSENLAAAARAALWALLAVSMGCASNPRSAAQRQSDQETVDRVQAALDADGELYARHISVHAYQGVVRLGGFVWDQPDLEEAVRVATDVPGVARVVNDMELERNGIDNSPVSR